MCAADVCYLRNHCEQKPNANDNMAAVDALLDEVVATVLLAEISNEVVTA